MTIRWRDEMTIDHGVIDHDHQTLIGIINKFCDTPPTVEGLSQQLAISEELRHYTATHFEREESLQASVQYAFREAHHHEHGELIRDLDRLRGRLIALANDIAAAGSTDGESTSSSAQVDLDASVKSLHLEMTEFLHHWLIDHVIKSDLRMKPYAERLLAHAPKFGPLTQSVILV